MKRLLFILIFALGLAGCTAGPEVSQNNDNSDTEPAVTLASLPEPPSIFYPISSYSDRATFKVFDQQVNDRFSGWHVGDDLEIFDDELEEEVPVYAMADGKIVYRNWLSGYGGVIVLQHEIGGQTLQSIYGHIDLSQTRPRLGEYVRAGTLITYLGDDKSNETDGERKHLHFGLYPGSALRLDGYARLQAETDNWINPSEYLKSNSAANPKTEIVFPDDWKRHNLNDINEEYRLSILLPENWQAEYVAASESVNLFMPSEERGPMDNSMIFIRRFDANTFLTLSTVIIHQRFLNTIGSKPAVDYEIEKKQAVADFPNQPSWRNEKHNVTDIRESDGFSRFYVFGQNPELDEKTIYYILRSIEYVSADLQNG